MRFTFVILIIALLIPASALGAWPNDPTVNLPVCTAPAGQLSPRMASDGAGGVIIAWEDNRGGYQNSEVYAQHVLASGLVDPAWPLGGLAVCTAPGPQHYVKIVSDGAGGAIISWDDPRVPDPQHLGNDDVYAQHVLPGGIVDPAWPVNGLAVCTAASTQFWPAITTDGAGGAIVAWSDSRSGWVYVYAQHVRNDGTVDPGWPINGVGLCLVGWQVIPQIVSDGAGGAIVTWQDYRTSYESSDVYAQHILANGVVDPAWPALGLGVCTAAGGQYSPAIIADGAGGAIIGWEDKRSGNFDAYIQHVLANGTADPAWPAGGRALCTAPNDQTALTIVADGAGGAIAAWDDARNGNHDIYAQRVLANGTTHPAWPGNGRALCTAVNDQQYAVIVSDDAGGAIVTWWDRGPGAYVGDIYAQHVLAIGEVDPDWPAEGRGVSTAVKNQGPPDAIADGTGGVVAAWTDCRNAGSDCYGGADIYAQRVQANGQLGGSVCVKVAFDLAPEALNLRSMGRWVTATLEPDPPASPADIDVASILLNGSVPVDPSAPVSIGDASGDGRPDLTVKFDRAAVQLVLEEGDAVTVTVTGNMNERCFSATDVVRVVRGHVTAPVGGSELLVGTTTEVRWETPTGMNVQSVAVLFSANDGASWDLVAHELPNTGSYSWTLPDAITAQGRIAVVWVTSADESGYEVDGVLGVSGRFTVTNALDAGPPELSFALQGAIPNPSHGLRVSFSLPNAEPATLAVYDVTGRQIAMQQVSSLGPGRHVVSLERPGLAPGVYLVHLAQGNRKLVARAVVIQ